ncbi:hypothetical protein TNCV_2546551 [Trichonephila clavipes]|nr:hypothetical protein TNCV_2546551 [Trichonephila clavipes]
MVFCTTGDFTTRKRDKLACREIVEGDVVIKPLVVLLHYVAVVVGQSIESEGSYIRLQFLYGDSVEFYIPGE